MTMADTIAVMNAGRIEQMGSPAELYEHPRTTFVANFLGQSNLVKGNVLSQDGDHLEVEVQGARLRALRDRSPVEQGEVWVGVRPEKMSLQKGAAGGANRLGGGRVTDVSFVGVSTQYLVRMPWGQELMVFEQNTGAGERIRAGDEVELCWEPPHTFLLDASQDALAGSELPDEA